MDSRRLSFVVGDDAKLKEKHQDLLKDYLVLQKECVVKKRKVKESKERKVALMNEISFLKRRRNFLLKQSQNSEPKQKLFQSHKTDGNTNVEPMRGYMTATASTSTSAQAFQNHRPPMIPIQKTGSGGKEAAAFPSLNLGKKAKNVFTNSKRAEKRKISWQDQLALKV